MIAEQIIDQLEAMYTKYHDIKFIEDDPISVPHRYSNVHDIEIAGFFAALFSWGKRKTTIEKSLAFMKLMDDRPFDFILNHYPSDLKKIEKFVHRTFNGTDALFFIYFLQKQYRNKKGLQDLFCDGVEFQDTIEGYLNNFYLQVTQDEFVPGRTLKHVSAPSKNSACKRLCMYFRWMVRKDTRGVDFGIWKKVKPKQLVCPVDVHVLESVKLLQLMHKPKPDWKSAKHLTELLRIMDPEDPVKYDFALFGLGLARRQTDAPIPPRK